MNSLKKEETQGENVVVSVHKAYPGKVAAIKDDLQKFHSDNGMPIESVEVGDYVKIVLQRKDYNDVESVKRSLKGHENHPAYSADNVLEQVEPKLDKVAVKSNISSIREKAFGNDMSNNVKFKR